MNTLKKIFAVIIFITFSNTYGATLDQNEFTNHFLKQAKATLKDTEFSYVRPLQIYSKNVNGFELNVFLDNSYAQYVSSPNNLQQITNSHLESIKSSQELLANGNGKSIFAVIKSNSYLTAVQKQLQQAGLGDKDIPFVYRKLNDDLLVFYVFDATNGVRMITKKDLSGIGVDEKSIDQIALSNLSKHFENKKPQIKRLGNFENAKIYTVAIDQFYESSSLLIKQYWTSKNFDVQGDIVTFVPSRDLVIVTGSQDKEGLRIAAYLAQKAFNELGYAISPNGYLFENGAWRAIPF